MSTNKTSQRRIPIIDHKGFERGHVGVKATEATVARLLGQRGSKLVKRNGKLIWQGPKP